MNDFCTDFPAVHLNQAKAKAFLAAYQAIRPLSADEQACINVYLAGAACRFWLLRLSVVEKNKQQGRVGEDILQKNPVEMRNMLIERLKAVEL